MGRVTFPLHITVEQKVETVRTDVVKQIDALNILDELQQAYCRHREVPDDAWIDAESGNWMHGTEAQPGNFEDEYVVRPARAYEVAVMEGFFQVRKGFPKKD